MFDLHKFTIFSTEYGKIEGRENRNLEIGTLLNNFRIPI